MLALGLVATGARLDHEAWARGLFTTKYRALAQSTQDNRRARSAGKWPHDSSTGLEVSTCTDETIRWTAALELVSSCRSHAHCASPSTAPEWARPMPSAADASRSSAAK